MSTTVEYQRNRAKGKKVPGYKTFGGELRKALLADLQATTAIRFPSPRYREDPVAFAREILGVEPWSKQIEVLEAVRDNMRVTVSSGHKTGKSNSAGILALWYFCSFPDARVIMSSTTDRQVNQILWREVRMLRERSGRCVHCKRADPEGFRIPVPCPHSAVIPEVPSQLARTGLRSSDFREIVGFTAREPEAMAGISGGNLLYILDEATGIPQEIFEAIEGNRAGGARICMYSNPTRNEGEFYESFFNAKKASTFYQVKISSAETPNAVSGKVLIPGLATREWIEEKRQEWGEDSPMYRVRVLGEFAIQEEGRIFSLKQIDDAEERWLAIPEPGQELDTGRLFIGVDPAGSTGTGDETVFALRRGKKVTSIHPFRALDADGHLLQILDLIRQEKRDGDPIPVVVLDKGGEVGSKLWGRLLNYVETCGGQFEVVGIQASDKAMRQPTIYDRMRDELTANYESWLREGGAIPRNGNLQGEMHQMTWKSHVSGRLKVTPKDDIRKNLGRSPDTYDAVVLACWTPADFRDDVEQPGRQLQQKTAAPTPGQMADYWESALSEGNTGFVY